MKYLDLFVVFGLYLCAFRFREIPWSFIASTCVDIGLSTLQPYKIVRRIVRILAGYQVGSFGVFGSEI